MEIIHINASNLNYWGRQSTPSVMALGFFDGVHRGHQKVIQTAGSIAKEKNLSLTVMSFFPHPKTILIKNKAFDYVMPLSKKASVLESFGVDTFYVVECNKDFLSLLPEQFVSRYLLSVNVMHAVAGFDFTYGHKAAGDIARLKRDSKEQIDVTKVEKMDFQERKISSTWLRELIISGNIEMLSSVLGRHYETEMYWDGKCFRLLPYYMLPSHGTYQVTIEIKGRHYDTEIFMPVDQKGVYIINSSNNNFYIHERATISWIRKVTTTVNYTNSVYML